VEEKKEEKNNAMGLWLSIGLWVIIFSVGFGLWYSCEKKDAEKDPGFKPGFTTVTTTTIVAPTNAPVEKPVPRVVPNKKADTKNAVTESKKQKISSVVFEAPLDSFISLAEKNLLAAHQKAQDGIADNFSLKKEGVIKLGKN